MKHSLALVLALIAIACAGFAGSPQVSAAPTVQAQPLTCPCPVPTYQRISASATLAQPAKVLPTHLVELDTDAGAFTLTLPPTPTHMTRFEVWLGSQPGGTATVDPNGQPVTYTPGLSDLSLDVANEGRLLVFIDPDGVGPGGGYWRASEL